MAQKRIEVIVDVESNDIKFATERTLTLTEQIRILKKELQKTQEGTKEFEVLKNKLNETQDQFTRVNAKSRELFGTLSLIPGPIGDISSRVDGAISLLKTFSGFSLKDLSSQFKALKDDITGILINLGTWGSSTENVKAANDVLTESTEDQSSAFKENVQAQLSVETANARVADAITQTNSSKEKLTNTTNTATTAIKSEAAADAQLTVATEAATAGTEVQTVATNTLTASARASAIAFGVLRAVLFSLGIGAIIAAVGFLIDKLSSWFSSTKEVDAANQKLTETLAGLQRQLDVTQQSIVDETKLLVTRAKIAGKTTDEISAIEISAIQKRIEANKKGRELLDRNAQQILTDTKITAEQRKKLLEDNEKAIVKNSQENTDLLVAQRQALADDELRRAEEKKAKDDKNEQDRKTKAREFNEKRLQEQKAQLDAEIQLEINSENTRRDLLERLLQERLALEKLTGNRLLLAQQENSEKVTNAIKDDAQKVLDLRAKELDALIELEKNKGEQGLEVNFTILRERLDERMKIELKELEGVENAEAQKQLIREKYARIAEDLEKKIINDRIQRQITGWDNELQNLELSYADRTSKLSAILDAINELEFTKDEEGLQRRLQLRESYQKLFLDSLTAQGDEQRNLIQANTTEASRFDSEYYTQLRNSYDSDLANYRQALDDKKITQQQYTQFEAETNKARRDLDILEAQSKADTAAAVGNAVQGVAEIIGQNTVAGKALAIAAATINTYAAIAGQLAAFAGVPIPGFAIAQAIATGAVGLAQIAKILKVKVPSASDTTSGTAEQKLGAVGGVIQVQGQRRAAGGLITGAGNEYSDSIPTMLSNGEFVVNARSTRAFQPLLTAINSYGSSPQFAGGTLGMVSNIMSANGQNESLSKVVSDTIAAQPIRTYVSSTEISNNQQFDRIVKSRSLI
jgi:hypothetical protein